MDDTKSKLSKFSLRFPPANRDKATKRNKLAEIKVPDQPEIEYLVLRKLANHLNIPPDQHMWCELALVLAQELLPEPKREGARLKWTPNLDAGLIGEVQRLIETSQKSKTFTHTCRSLARLEPWLSLINSKSNNDRSEVLRKRYYKLQKNKDFFANAMEQYKALKKEGKWSQYVSALVA